MNDVGKQTDPGDVGAGDPDALPVDSHAVFSTANDVLFAGQRGGVAQVVSIGVAQDEEVRIGRIKIADVDERTFQVQHDRSAVQRLNFARHGSHPFAPIFATVAGTAPRPAFATLSIATTADNGRRLDLDRSGGFFYRPAPMSAHTLLLRLFLVACCSAAAISNARAQAQQPNSRSVASVAVGTTDGVVLLKNGETLDGRISRSGDYYLIVSPTAEVQVRVREVEALCRDVEEVYAKKHALVNTRSADSYLALAQWCIDRQLYGYAARALTDAYRIDDTHPRIELLERRMKAAMTPPAPVATPPKPPEPKFNDAELDRAVKSVSAESLHEFTVRVQPLMMNYCATAGCHGPRAASTFQLERIYLNERTDPRIVRSNLHAVLKQVDRAQPAKSPLLNVPITAHGGAKKPIFNAHNAEHYRIVAGWVGRLSQHARYAPQPTSADVVSSANTLQQRMPLAPPSVTVPNGASGSTAPPAGVGPSVAAPLDAASTGTPTPTAPPTPAAPAVPRAGVDPFDPEVFNRRTEAAKP